MDLHVCGIELPSAHWFVSQNLFWEGGFKGKFTLWF